MSDETRAVDAVESLQGLTRVFLALATRSLEPVGGLSIQRMRLLFAIHDSGPGTGARYAADLRVSASSISRHADWLEAEGYLVRRANTSNRSAVSLHLTTAGGRVVAAVLQRRAAVFEQALSGLDPDQVRELARSASLLQERLSTDG